MKVRVIRPFFDKYDLSRLYSPGDVVDVDEKRAEDIVLRGLGEKYVKSEPKAEPKEAPKEEPKAEPKKRTRKRKTEEKAEDAAE